MAGVDELSELLSDETAFEQAAKRKAKAKAARAVFKSDFFIVLLPFL